MRKFVFLIGLLLSLPALAQVYRWVDADGVVHFSDRPVEGAERVELPESRATNFRRVAPSANRAAPSATPANNTQPAAKYESLTVVTPSDEETLWNIGGTLNVTLSLSPTLQAGHQVEVWFDGSVLDRTDPRSLSFTVPNVYRGRHNLWARVVDTNGNVLIQSNDVTFFVQQTSIANPP